MSSSTSGMYYGAETGVFWDLDECPIPDDMTPASVCANIRSALKNAGYVGEVSIVAKQTALEFESAHIKLVQSGESWEKCSKLYSDIFKWAMRHLYVPSNLMLISEDLVENYVKVLTAIKKQHNNIIVVPPCDDPSELLRSIASSLWLWHDISTGGSVQVVTPSPTSSCSGRSLRPTDKKQMNRGLKSSRKLRKISSYTKKKQF